jgi:hypothetical protein
MKIVAEFYCLVRGLRLYAGDDRPVVFGADWVARKLGLPKMTAWRAIRRLRDAGWFVCAETLPGYRGRSLQGKTFAYLPGVLPAGAEPLEVPLADGIGPGDLVEVTDELVGLDPAVEEDHELPVKAAELVAKPRAGTVGVVAPGDRARSPGLFNGHNFRITDPKAGPL